MRKGDCLFLDYVIVNTDRKVFIRLNKNGKPETCAKAQRFESSKARNILDNLPKPLKKFHFKVEAIPEEMIHKKETNIRVEQGVQEPLKTLSNPNYCTPSSINEWLVKVSNCNKLAQDAAKRKEELIKAKSSADRKLSNKIHKIELEKRKNACAGYQEYDELKSILEKRRIIKDELMIVSLILSSNLESIATDRVQKAVKGLNNRVFSMRETEDFDKIFE